MRYSLAQGNLDLFRWVERATGITCSVQLKRFRNVCAESVSSVVMEDHCARGIFRGLNKIHYRDYLVEAEKR
jgi:hypothetical protein